MIPAYELLKRYVGVWRNSATMHLLLLEGEPGMGKTFEIEKYLKDNKQDFLVVNSHITPLGLYRTLYVMRDGFIVLDDVLKLFKSEENRGMLMAATQTGESPREITYTSSTDRLGDIPQRFEFSGKIVVICNKLPKRMDALRSRSYPYNLTLTYEEKIQKITEVANAKNIPIEVVDFIKRATTKHTPPDILNIRLLLKLDSIYKEFPGDWESLGTHVVMQDNNMYILSKILNADVPVEEKIAEYIRLTGKSRSSFYYHKKKIESGKK
jgi:hypothetical protein